MNREQDLAYVLLLRVERSGRFPPRLLDSCDETAHAVTCSPSLKGRGFSVHCPHQRRDSPKGLPGPLNIPGRVLVAVQHQPAVRADVGTHTEALLLAFAAPATVLRGERRRHHFHSLASPFCLASEEMQEAAPSGVLDAFS